MDDDSGGACSSLLDRPLPPAFDVRQVVIAPGSDFLYHEDTWRDALVVVERGEIELVCISGAHRRFLAGDVLCLAGLPLRSLRNRGADAVVLSAVSRRRSAR
jgi:quercetin dioxygenase-like cupin family protein